MFFRSVFSVLPDPREGQACRGAEVVPQGSAQTEVALWGGDAMGVGSQETGRKQGQ